MEIRPLTHDDREALIRFLTRVSDADRTFFKEDVGDPAALNAIVRPGPARTVAVEAGEVVGWLDLVPLHGSSDHVGDVRLIVDPSYRGRGIGRMLARQAVLEAVTLGLSKVVVEVIAQQEETIGMFRAVGFDPEALLADHVRDATGELRDLMILSQSVDAQLSSMLAVGLADEL